MERVNVFARISIPVSLPEVIAESAVFEREVNTGDYHQCSRSVNQKNAVSVSVGILAVVCVNYLNYTLQPVL